jgi:hypothetical protein
MSLSKDRKYCKTNQDQPPGRPDSEPVSRRFAGVVRGLFVRLLEDGTPAVDFDGNPNGVPVAAVSTIGVAKQDAGREAILMFEDCDPRRPIVLGLVHASGTPAQKVSPIEASLDGEHVTLTAEKEIVLRCGHASITLTRAGKILIRGKYLLSRSSGVNRIKGGSVQIN